MTAPIPVEEDDLLAGAVVYLQSLLDVTSLVGSDSAGPYIWQEDKLVNFEAEPTTGIVVTTSATSLVDEAHTQHFERLGIEIWAGPIRDNIGNIVETAETRRRISRVYKALDRHLHRVAPHTQWWGTVRTHSSERIGGLDIFPAPEGNGVMIGQVFYVVQLD